MTEPLWSVVMLLALVGCCLLAYSLRILDAMGSTAAFVLGGAILWFGGLSWFSLMVVFTGLAFVATRFGRRRKLEHGTAEEREGERGAPNVVANGAAPAVAALSILVAEPSVAAVAYVAAVCAITADTLASEIGGMASRARCILPPFARQAPGTNGAVSWLGQVAAAVGPAAVAAIAVPLVGITWEAAAVALVAGFVGSQLDSILGATVERDADHPNRPFGKGAVNFVASIIPTIVVLLVMRAATTV